MPYIRRVSCNLLKRIQKQWSLPPLFWRLYPPQVSSCLLSWYYFISVFDARLIREHAPPNTNSDGISRVGNGVGTKGLVGGGPNEERTGDQGEGDQRLEGGGPVDCTEWVVQRLENWKEEGPKGTRDLGEGGRGTRDIFKNNKVMTKESWLT